MSRKAADPAFTGQEQQGLIQLLPYIAHALTHPGSLVQWVDSGEEGLIVADGGGVICNISIQGRQILARAMLAGEEAGLPSQVIELCRLLALPPGDENSATEAEIRTETWRHENLLERYVFHAQLLLPAHAVAQQPLIAITVWRQEALPLKLLRAVEKLPLSFREMQFCLQLANGHSQAGIAQRMNISEHTAVSHRRQVYVKLAVHNRTELMSRLLAL